MQQMNILETRLDSSILVSSTIMDGISISTNHTTSSSSSNIKKRSRRFNPTHSSNNHSVNNNNNHHYRQSLSTTISEQYNTDLNGGSVSSLRRERIDDVASSIDNGILPNPKQQTFNTSAVKIWRLIVLGVLTISTIITSIAVYKFTSNQESNNFNTNFYNDADKVIISLTNRIERKFGIIDSWLINIMSYSKYTNQDWPYVNIANFSVRVNKMNSLSNSIVIRVAPFVQSEQRLLYENYTTNNNFWVNESIIVQQLDDTNHALPININNYSVCNVIYGDDERTKDQNEYCTYGTNRSMIMDDDNDNDTLSSSFYVPIRQMAPIPAHYPPYNYDYMSRKYAQDLIQNIVYKKSRAVISKASLIPGDTDPIHANENIIDSSYYSNFIQSHLDPYEPLSDIYYPISDRLDRVRPELDNDDITNNYNKDIVAIVVMSFYWRDTIKNILPNNSDGLIIVFENPCNPTFSYLINGSDVAFLGNNDAHDPYHNDNVRTLSFTSLSVYSTNASSYTGFPVDLDHCPFTIKIYPSSYTQAHYVTNNPIYYTLAVVAIFLFTSSVFLIYNYWVERRQKQIMLCAIESTINVNELEHIVHNRTLKLQQINQQLEIANEKIRIASIAQLEHFACMSHEIRTPLNGINGLSTVVRDDIKRLIDIQNHDTNLIKNSLISSLELMNGIASSGELLRRIVDDVLDFAKLGSGKVEIDMQDNICLQDILDSVLTSIQAMESVKSKKLTMKTIYDIKLGPYISTDSRRLQQILFNLIGNAVKFSHPNSIIELHVHMCNDQCIDIIETTAKNNVLRFIVKDYGKGIPRDKFQAIFEPFIQADGDNTDVKHAGTGLGLAITSRLVHALHGIISVDSEVNQWTKFQVDFPLNDIIPNSGSCHNIINNNIIDTISPKLINTLFLFVDDNDDDRKQIEIILDGYKVKYISFTNLIDVEQHVQKIGVTTSGIVNVLLLRDDLVDDAKISYLKRTIHPNVILFNAHHVSQVTTSHGGLHRPLVRTLPSVMMTNIIDYIREGSNGDDNNRNASVINIEELFSNLRILIAEDNKINQKVIVRLLNKVGINNIIVVANGQLAVEQEAIESFDIILMDMHMPIMDGLDACKLIMESRQKGGIVDTNDNDTIPIIPTTIIQHEIPKIVFLTAHVSDIIKKECLDAGAIDFLSKPCRIESITECFRKILLIKSSESSIIV